MLDTDTKRFPSSLIYTVLRFHDIMVVFLHYAPKHDAELHHESPSHEDFTCKTSKTIGTRDFLFDKRMNWKVPRQRFSIDIEI
jgi:hypothetical protein